MSTLNDIRPLRSDADHAWAIAEIEKVLSADYGTPEGERLELLSILVNAYEGEHHRIPDPTPEQALDFARDQGREDVTAGLPGMLLHFDDTWSPAGFKRA